ncbi:MAG: PepSY-like domain-containing protein [Saprospiraceae bacterium]
MKKLSIFFLVTVFFASCELIDSIGGDSIIDDIANASKTTIDFEELPTNAQTELNENYFETFVEEASLAEGLGYEVLLSSGENVYFDTEGDLLKPERKRGKKGKGDCNSIDTTELLQLIKDYVATNYPDESIKRAKEDKDGNFIVGLTGHVFLLFDSEGAFVEIHEFAHRKHGEKVEIEDLPTAITDYITANYEGATIKVAFSQDDEYRVGIINNENERVLVIFDSEGNFVEEKTCNK